ncbi:MAG: NUDIX hydrolase [Gracilibacteraceae bacterium]|jgi:ADP-ribose pyrophosphatase YjhB (NUDIX family)|nr:NUDIX hydrolase [Gracilibacteraceae bacterium]
MLSSAVYRFCPCCAAPLRPARLGGRERRQCPDCGFVYWGQSTIGAGGVVVQDGRVLLVRRALEPGRGRWTLPGGFAEENERAEETAVREVLEETGLSTEAVSLLAVRDRPGEGGAPHDIYLVFLLAYRCGTLRPQTEEVSAAGFFHPDGCAGMNVAPLSLAMMRLALAGDPAPGFKPVAGIDLFTAAARLYGP